MLAHQILLRHTLLIDIDIHRFRYLYNQSLLLNHYQMSIRALSYYMMLSVLGIVLMMLLLLTFLSLEMFF